MQKRVKCDDAMVDGEALYDATRPALAESEVPGLGLGLGLGLRLSPAS